MLAYCVVIHVISAYVGAWQQWLLSLAFSLSASLLLGRRLSLCADAAAIVGQSAPAVALSNFIVRVSIVMASAVGMC